MAYHQKLINAKKILIYILNYPLFLQILDTPSLLQDSATPARKNIFKQNQENDTNTGGCC